MDCPAFLKPSVLCDFLLCGEGWCWKLSDMKFICQYLLDICLHWCKSMIDICRWSDSPDDGDIGSLRVLHFHRPLALSVNPTLQEHPSFQRVRSTPGQRVKVIEEFKVIERKTIYVPGMKIVTKFVLWICTYKLSLLKFLSYLS